MKSLITKIKDRSRYTITKRNDYLFISTDRVEFRFILDTNYHPQKYEKTIRAEATCYSSTSHRINPLRCNVNNVTYRISIHYPSPSRVERRFGTKAAMDKEIREEFRKIILTFNIQFTGIRDV